MKKTFVSALTAALVAGVAGSAFAAANPFADVPADHWAYDAVSQLAADGVIEGYGDSTFRGDRNITRYEMAQMVARAMAKSDVSAADKAVLDKLAAEFSEELNSLGVRVANLERNADMVKWTGEMRYRYWSYRQEQNDSSTRKANVDSLQLRLFPTAEVNDHWTVNGRLTGSVSMNSDTSGNMRLSYVYAQGKYGNFEVKFGKMPFYSQADEGLVMDDFFSGAAVSFGKNLKVKLEAGRWNINSDANTNVTTGSVNDPASYQGIDITGTAGKLTAGAAYKHFNSDVFRTANRYKNNGTTDKAGIWSVGAAYAFDKNVKLSGAYAQNTKADNFGRSYSVELAYKGANRVNRGSWGAFVGYRYLGGNVSLMPTYDTAHANVGTGLDGLNVKGWDLSASYIPMKNTLTTLGYFRGKQFENGKKAETLYARLSYYF